jgi:predicted transcriptional regulator
MKVSVELSAPVEERLTEVAKRLKVPIEQLAAAAVRDLLARPDADFDQVATRVLEKNRELYRRLA